MSKIFAISGNLIGGDGVWIQPKPNFKGEIVVEDNNRIFGYCNSYKEKSQIQRLFLTGMAIRNGNSCGAAIYVLSNDPRYIPAMLLAADFGSCYGGWFRLNSLNILQFQGKADLHFEELPLFSSKVYEVRTVFNRLDETIGLNKEYIYDPNNLEKYVTSAMLM